MNYLFGFYVETTLNSHVEIYRRPYLDNYITLKFPPKPNGKIKAFIELEGNCAKDLFDLAHLRLQDYMDALSYVMSSSAFVSNLFVILKNERGSNQRIAMRKIINDRYDGLYLRNDTLSVIDEVVKITNINVRISQCLRWLRYGYRARTIFEQFNYYWLALERYVGETDVESICPKCGNKSRFHTTTSKDGIRMLINKHQNLSNSEFNKIWRSRQKVFHGNKIDTKFARVLSSQVKLILSVMIKELNEILKPQRRINLNEPVGGFRRFSIDAFYRFNTSKPDIAFAMDYPTDAQIKRFQQTPDVISKDGFELINFESQLETW